MENSFPCLIGLLNARSKPKSPRTLLNVNPVDSPPVVHRQPESFPCLIGILDASSKPSQSVNPVDSPPIVHPQPESFPCLIGILNAQSKSNQSQRPLNVNPIYPSSVVHSQPAKKKSNRNHVQFCAGPNCGNNRYDNPGLSFFRFPKDEVRSKQWVNNTRRKDVITQKSAKQLNTGTVLCANHFEANQFISKRLKKTAVPTLFDVPNPPKTLTPARKTPKPRPYLPLLKKKLLLPSLDQPPEDISTVVAAPPSKLAKAVRRIKTLRNKIESQRMRLKRLQTPLSMKKFKTSQQEIRHIKDLTCKYLNKDADFFLTRQLENSLQKRNKWTARDKSFALTLYHTSPKAYRLLQKIFCLPSLETLRRVMRNIEIYPGFSTKLLGAFKLKVDQMSSSDRLCVLLLDEITLTKKLFYNVERDCLEGFEDYGDLLETEHCEPGSHACVFMARGLMSQWKQPFGYVITQNQVNNIDLKIMLNAAIQQIKSVNLKLKALVCDQGPNNVAAVKSFGVTKENPFFITDDGEKIFVFYDPPHLIKSVRNNLMKYDFQTEEGVAAWKVIVDFYHRDCALGSFRMVKKLKKKHLELNSFAKMRVYLATQVLSHSVAKAIGTLCSLGIFPPEHMATSHFLEMFDCLFNVFNGSLLSSSAKYRHPITLTSSHHQFLDMALPWLENLKYTPTHKNKPTQQMPATNLPCIAGWIQNIHALKQFLPAMVGVEPGVQYIVTNRLNQDALENLFSVIRGKGSHHDNPDPQQFRYRLRQVMVDKILIPSKVSNCQDDVDSFLVNLTRDRPPPTETPLLTMSHPIEPLQIVNLVKSCAATDITHLDNAIAYVSGWILKKVYPLICNECILKLEFSPQEGQPTPAHLTLIEMKQYDNCLHGGLKKPSLHLVKAITSFEADFLNDLKLRMKDRHIRKTFTEKLLQTVTRTELKGEACNCPTVDLVIQCFISVRLHHEIRMMNESIAQEKIAKEIGRKNRKLMKVSHK